MPNDSMLAAISRAAANPEGVNTEMITPKTIEQLTTDLNASTANITALQVEVNAQKTRADTEKTRADAAEAENKKLKAEPEETLQIGDLTVKKSEVGATSFAAMKAQQKQIEDRDSKLAHAGYKVTAETTYASLPGTPDAKASALLALTKLGAEEQKTINAMLVSGNTAMKATGKALGTDLDGGGADDPQARLDSLAAKYASDKNVSSATAMDAVLKTADGKKLYGEIRAGTMRTNVEAA